MAQMVSTTLFVTAGILQELSLHDHDIACMLTTWSIGETASATEYAFLNSSSMLEPVQIEL
jgi:hypothetical protein